MTNLIRQDATAVDLSKLFATSPLVPLLPPVGDPAWTAVRNNPLLTPLLTDIRQRAMQDLDQPMPVLTDEMYADFSVTGRRLPFESQYFERRRRLARAAIATLTEPNEQQRQVLLRSALNKLQDIFGEAS